jgi:hypothetical protein
MVLPDLTGKWLWKEDAIFFENPESMKVIRELNTYKVKIEPVETPPPTIRPLRCNTYKFYKLTYLDGPYANYPVLVIEYKTLNGVFFQGAESADTGLSTIEVKCSINSRAIRMEGIYQESGFIQDIYKLQAPKIGYSVFIRDD